VINRGKEVTTMLTISKTRLRRLLAAALTLGVLAVAMPATGLASNVGGGPIATR
jgi:hypothetical protein